jgi:hypothetical protein
MGLFDVVSRFLEKPRGKEFEARRLWHDIRGEKLDLANGFGPPNAPRLSAMLKTYRYLAGEGLSDEDIAALMREQVKGSKRDELLFDDFFSVGDFFEKHDYLSMPPEEKEKYLAHNERQRAGWWLNIHMLKARRHDDDERFRAQKRNHRTGKT